MFGTYRTSLAVLVVAEHLWGVSNIGAYAVFGFYILSGYLMTLIMHSTYGFGSAGVAKYAANRFLRVYPVYWTAASASALLIWLVGVELAAAYHPDMYLPDDVTSLLKHLALYVHVSDEPRLIPPAWALTVELCFYLLIGVGLSRRRLSTWIWFLGSLAYHAVAYVYDFDWGARYFTVPAASLPFATGALLFHYRDRVSESFVALPARGALTGALALAMVLNWWVGEQVGQARGLAFYSNYVICALLTGLLHDRRSLPGIDRKMDGLIGDLSYPIYLWHFPIGLCVVAVAAGLGVSLERPSGALFVLSLPVVLAGGWLSHRMIAKPVDLARERIKSGLGRG